jgi:hypothetical protein
MAGDKANAKVAYEKFFQEWKQADAGLPVMAQQRRDTRRCRRRQAGRPNRRVAVDSRR